MNIPKNIFREICIGGIKIYQRALSPFLPQCCRYHPSCSEYAVQSIDAYGVWKGGILALRRLSRCHPWGGGGLDPVNKQEASWKKHLSKPAAGGNVPLLPADRKSHRPPRADAFQRGGNH